MSWIALLVAVVASIATTLYLKHRVRPVAPTRMPIETPRVTIEPVAVVD